MTYIIGIKTTYAKVSLQNIKMQKLRDKFFVTLQFA